MRIRTVKPEFFLHAELHDAEIAEGLPLRLAFIGLWCAADREGRFRWEPRRLKAQIMPYDEGLDFSRVLHALATRGFLVHYASDGAEFGCIPSFSRHQVINNREADSALPKYADESQLLTRAPRVHHAWGTRHDLAQAEGKGKEGNKERRGAEHPDADASPSLPFSGSAAFASAWADYCAYRRSAKLRTLKQASVAAQLREIETWGEAAAIEAIRTTIRNGWQGIFPPKSTTGRTSPSTSVPNDILNAF